MKFLLLCREFSYDLRFRDAVTVEVGLTAKALCSAGHEVVIVAGREGPHVSMKGEIPIVRIPEDEIVNPFKYKELLNVISRLRCDSLVNYLSFMLFPKFVKLLNRLHIHAFHRVIHGPLVAADVQKSLRDLLLRYPMLYGKIDFYDLARLLYPDFLVRAASRSQVLGNLITLSKRTRGLLIKAGFDDDRVITVPPPVEPIWYGRGRIKSGQRKILYYGGGPSIFRGLGTLLQSVALISDPQLSIEMYLRGGNQVDARLITDLARALGLVSRTRVALGFQEPSYLVEKVSQADCVVLPIKTMAKIADIPLAAIEPMACGTPVISTKVGAMDEIVRHEKNGILVSPASVKQLSLAIKRVTTDRSFRTSLSECAMDTAQEYHSSVIIGKLVKSYESWN